MATVFTERRIASWMGVRRAVVDFGEVLRIGRVAVHHVGPFRRLLRHIGVEVERRVVHGSPVVDDSSVQSRTVDGKRLDG